MGLNHPRDLAAWQRWQDGRKPLQRLRGQLRPAPPLEAQLTVGGSEPTVLVVLDSSTPSSRAALEEPIRWLDSERVAVLSSAPAIRLLPGERSRVLPISGVTDLHRVFPSVRLVVAIGNFLPFGALGHGLAIRNHLPFFVVQHGLMTPFAPPLPVGAHLLAWSQVDGDFWRSGRDDVTFEVAGSQLLWDARRSTSLTDPATPPTYLGQLHGAELPRRDLARAAAAFCLEHGAVYRPHPSERDLLSRGQHALWRRRGLRFDTSGGEIAELGTPIVSVFSTGVLEAASAGIPAWVDYPAPPAWLEELWDRYDLARWGGAPTLPPTPPPVEPARRIAEIMLAHLEGVR